MDGREVDEPDDGWYSVFLSVPGVRYGFRMQGSSMGRLGALGGLERVGAAITQHMESVGAVIHNNTWRVWRSWSDITGSAVAFVGHLLDNTGWGRALPFCDSCDV